MFCMANLSAFWPSLMMKRMKCLLKKNLNREENSRRNVGNHSTLHQRVGPTASFGELLVNTSLIF